MGRLVGRWVGRLVGGWVGRTFIHVLTILGVRVILSVDTYEQHCDSVYTPNTPPCNLSVALFFSVQLSAEHPASERSSYVIVCRL